MVPRSYNSKKKNKKKSELFQHCAWHIILVVCAEMMCFVFTKHVAKPPWSNIFNLSHAACFVLKSYLWRIFRIVLSQHFPRILRLVKTSMYSSLFFFFCTLSKNYMVWLGWTCWDVHYWEYWQMSWMFRLYTIFHAVEWLTSNFLHMTI